MFAHAETGGGDHLEQTKRYDLVIVPTGGNMANVRAKRIEPTPHGKKRCEKALAMAIQGEARAVAFAGGFRYTDPTEADVYAEWFQSHFSEHAKNAPIAFEDASEALSAKDLSSPSFLKKMDDYLRRIGMIRATARIGVISSSQHAERCAVTLHHHGFHDVETVDSGEPMPSLLYALMEPFLFLVTDLDPDWQGWIVRPLVRSAEQRKHEDLTQLLE